MSAARRSGAAAGPPNVGDSAADTPAPTGVTAPLTLGTAGHIDHGKTALVRALTGHETDRLAAERERGISIELGYAPLDLADGRRLSVVDVPGHERFVRTMVAGATGIDLFLLAIAADDGVMPQTIEHWTVLRALGVDDGVVAITKADLADPACAAAQARDLLGRATTPRDLLDRATTPRDRLDRATTPGDRLDRPTTPGTCGDLTTMAVARSPHGGGGKADGEGLVPIVPCSARTGEGLGALVAALAGVAAGRPGRAARGGAPILHVDRVFTVKGAGTVVTGTLWSGVLEGGATVRLLPSGRPARIRGLHVHDRAVQRAAAGQRVAVNLARVGREEVGRGDAIAGADADLAPTWVVEATLELRAPPTGHVHVHHGTRESPARLTDLGAGRWRVRARRPLLARPGDRLVIRSTAPPDTLGGGTIVAVRRRGSRPPAAPTQTSARRAAPQAGFAAAANAAPHTTHAAAPATPHTGAAPNTTDATIASAPQAGAAAAPTTDAATPTTVVSASGDRGAGAGAASPAPAPGPPRPPLTPEALALEERLRAAGHEPPSTAQLGADAAHLAALRAHGRAVRIGRDLHAHPDALAAVAERAVAILEAEGELTLARLRDELETSRKYAQALLEHLDTARVTLRLPDDRRVLRRRGDRPGRPAVSAPPRAP